MPVRANQIVEAMLGDEDPKERAYAQLQDLQGQRQRLQSERMFRASWAMTLHRLGYKQRDIASLDIRSDNGGRYLVGIELKKGDYKGKIDRAAAGRKQAKDAYAGYLDANDLRQDYPRKWVAQMRKELTNTVGAPPPRTPSTGFGGTTATAYYVPVIPPLYIPAHLGDDFNPR